MTSPVAAITANLTWETDQEFTGQVGKHELTIDGAKHAGPSPMDLLALSIAGCMSIDLVHILTKGRKKLTGLEARIVGTRADTEPRCYTRIELKFAVTTDAEPEVVERAIQLSRDKYCSVWRSMRQDIDLDVSFTIESDAV
jgi:putative redox protein